MPNNMFIVFLIRLESPSYSLLGSTESRANMFRERLLFTQQRLLRSELFTLRGLKANKSLKNRDIEELSTIESLLGSSGSHILFGMLTQVRDFPSLSFY